MHLHVTAELRAEAWHTGPDLWQGAPVQRIQPVRASDSHELSASTTTTPSIDLPTWFRTEAASDLDRAVADPTGRDISLALREGMH